MIRKIIMVSGLFLLCQAGTLVAGPSISQISTIIETCSNAEFSFNDAYSRLRSSGWADVTRSSEKRLASRHIAAVVHYSPDSNWQSNAREMARQIPLQLGRNNTTNSDAHTSYEYSLLRSDNGFGGYLLIGETIVINATGGIRARQRQCFAALETSPAFSTLRGNAPETRLGFRLPTDYIHADGGKYRARILQSTMPERDLGFSPIGTERLNITLHYYPS